MAEKALNNLSYEAYLTLENESETKYEFHGGFITAMAGGTLAHGQISVNLTRAVGNALENTGKPCITYSSDVKVHIDSTRRTFYPDASVVCEKPEVSKIDKNAVINPVLIIEVLSESTAAFDRGAKFSHYRKIDSLKEYVLVSQNEAMVDTYFRTENGTWEIHTILGLDGIANLKSIGCEIKMADIYNLVSDLDENQ